jgi:hypothetical protein
MEKYFEISKVHELYARYFEWLEFREKLIEIYKEFAKKAGIESSEFYPKQDAIGIVPTESDKEKFDKYFKVQQDRLRFFKRNTIYSKDWAKALRVNNLKILFKPSVSDYFSSYKFQCRLFAIEERLYGSYSCEQDDFNLQDGFVEMKASEFFKIIEDAEG